MKHHFSNVLHCFVRTTIELACWILPLEPQALEDYPWQKFRRLIIV
ncbi:hypothetical protein B0G77_4242 [Paraburkholderia sp. BL10I2N1]|nr:hypothetical protein B0G77_4242 [Paraburkholderia sp. BL10I2N1]